MIFSNDFNLKKPFNKKRLKQLQPKKINKNNKTLTI